MQAAAFRVAQEALHNALRHSGASEVSVTLSRTRRRVVLEVADNGTGFDPALASAGSGWRRCGSGRPPSAGCCGSARRPGAGTTVRLAVPT